MKHVRPLLLLVCLLAFSCTSRSSYLDGKVVASKGLEGIKLTLVLLDSTRANHRYPIGLEKDGSFRLGVRERGVYEAEFVLERFPLDVWKSPAISFYGAPSLRVDTSLPGVHHIPTLYVDDPLVMLTPKTGEQIALKGNYIFSWSADQNVKVYYLTIYRRAPDGTSQAVLTIGGINTNHLSLRDLLLAGAAADQFDYDKLKRGGMFKRATQRLSAGEYGIGVAGLVDVPSERRFISVTATEDSHEPVVRFY